MILQAKAPLPPNASTTHQPLWIVICSQPLSLYDFSRNNSTDGVVHKFVNQQLRTMFWIPRTSMMICPHQTVWLVICCSGAGGPRVPWALLFIQVLEAVYATSQNGMNRSPAIPWTPIFVGITEAVKVPL